MEATTASHPTLEPSDATRLERPSGGRDRCKATVRGEPFLPPVAQRSPAGDVDQALKARLDKLAQARAGSGRDRVPPTARTNAPTKKRRHPAKNSRTAALALSVLASGGLAFWFAKTDNAGSIASASPVGIVSESTSPAAPTTTADADVTASDETASTLASADTTTAEVAASPETTSTDTSTDSSVTPTTAATVASAEPVVINGDSFSNKWGNVQVQATFAADGTLTDVTTLQIPDADSKSVRINDQAVPVLTSEALSTQSANVDTISGATYTSVGYRQSLQSAIDIAAANGITTTASA